MHIFIQLQFYVKWAPDWPVPAPLPLKDLRTITGGFTLGEVQKPALKGEQYQAGRGFGIRLIPTLVLGWYRHWY